MQEYWNMRLWPLLQEMSSSWYWCDIAKVGVKHRSIYQKKLWKYQRINNHRLIHGLFHIALVIFFFFFFFFFIFNPLCRRTIRQYVEHVLCLCTVLVFPPPFEFVHIYTVKSYPHTLSIAILLYTVKILQFVRLLLKVNYMNRIV